MPGAITGEALSHSLAEAIAPLQALSDRIDTELAELNTKRAELMAGRRRVQSIIRQATGSKPKPVVAGRGGIAPARQDELAAWLKTNLDGQDFNAPDLLRRDDFHYSSRSPYLSKTLSILHQQGIIRLVHTGHATHGNRTKIWRLT